MEKESSKNIILQRKFSILTIIFLLIMTGILFGQKEGYKYTLLYQYQAIPDIELKNTLMVHNQAILPDGEISREDARQFLSMKDMQTDLSGEVRGFVKFDNLADQPKDARQYYIIKPLNKFDENLSQYFSLEEIIKMNYLSPRSLGVSELIEVNETKKTITLEDENGNKFFIDKTTKEVSIRDITGDSTTLITSDSDYKKFIIERSQLAP